MNKLVVLKLDGDFYEGFRVSLEIGEDGSLPDVELSDKELKLPPLPTLPDIYQDWSNSYRSLDGYRIKPKKEQITNVRFQSLKKECHAKADIIKQNFITWLQADSFRRIKELCLTQLTAADQVRVIIRTNETQLRKLPWHLWDLFEYYPHAEVALSSLSSQRFKKSDRLNTRILIILGNSEGINVAEDEKLLKKYCQAAEVIVLVEPTPVELNKHLWNEKGWDILLFSGHSRTESTKGRIFLNRSDSLTMDQLRYGLQTAVRRGLQLAFFNSCDGLGIAAELESLHIPQVIVMREPVPDKVAHQFLKDFIQEFTGRKSFYQSVNIARQKLQGLETDYPCASWLPVIVQNLLATPPTWQSMGSVANCPYRGLAAFKQEDAPYFYGRETVTQQLVTAVKKKHLVAVVGASGSGKSSVVFAGLIPQLKQDRSKNWQIVSFRPGNNPLESLAMAMPAAGIALSQGLGNGDWGLGTGKDFLSHHRLQELELEVELTKNDRTLQNFLESIIAASPKSHIVVIADQFEELYTLCQDTEERKIFLDHLLNAVQSVPGFTLVLTLRADFFGEALSYRPLSNALQDAQVNLGPMNAVELESAIAQPAQILNVQLEPGLTQRLIDVVLDSPSHLPLLEFTLTQLWQKQQQGWLTHQAYTDIGGVETALANHAESVYVQLNSADKERVQQIFIQLVQPTDNKADIRRLANREEVGEENWNLVTQLADARLLVTNRHEVTNIETVEIIHEALIKNWRRLQQWMQIDGEFRHWQEQLRVLIKQWEHSNQDAGALLRGKPLIDAEEWLLQRTTQINATEQSFINLSLELRNREHQAQNAAKKRTIILLTTGLVGALLLAGMALFQQQQAQINELQALNLSAKVLLKSGNEVEAFIPILQVMKNLEGLQLLDSQTKIGLSTSILENINQIREYNRFTGHQGEITSIKFSPDGQLLASASQDTTIKIWRRDGRLLQTLADHRDGVFSVIFSPNNQLLIAASFDNTISFWRYDTSTSLFENKPFFRLLEKDRLWALALSPDSKILATANRKGQIKLWTLDGQLIRMIPAHNQRIWSVNFSPDGQTLATASADKTVKLWNLEGKALKTLQGHSDEVLSVNFSPDSKFIASASKDKTVKIWDFTGQLLHTLDGHNNEILDVNFSLNSKFIASAIADDTVKLWSIPRDDKSNSPSLIYTFSGHGDKASEVSFSPDGKTIASASADKIIKLWHLQGILPSFPGNSVSISPDGKTVAVGNQQGIVTLRQRDGNLLGSFNAHEGEIIKVLFHPTVKNLVTIGVDNQIKLWNLEGKLLNSWQGHEKANNSISDKIYNPIQDASFSPDGKNIATIGRIDKQVKIWNLQGTLLKSWQTNSNLLTKINFSPDGKILATAGDKTVKLWNLEGKLLQTLSGHKDNIADAIFSPNGKIIATAGIDKTVKLWHSDSGKLFRTLQHNESVYSVGFSPNNQILVSASAAQINFWNWDGKLLNILQGHQGNISEVNFSSDGNIITSVDVNNRVILWNLDINDLQQHSCDWLRDYLNSHQNLDETNHNLCNKSSD
ncbi:MULTISPECIES: CHAT domain-containing protein [Nostoc]|uniref:CHAT domain-containing protein n=1 Tax=Nostoc paludosum FACHB-159 TaxID=2692908 RepID=A0ABR8KEW8_9NOSO|nr:MULTISPECIES: CHAT domain-containing protein [Nostoc]MBD2680927.1 CHAT domain-containing protein [Nostoc sp. FACHB-857]MBD2737403.1 CHAT domain-containing protein [Nostoc paludosum FACHB-159]